MSDASATDEDALAHYDRGLALIPVLKMTANRLRESSPTSASGVAGYPASKPPSCSASMPALYRSTILRHRLALKRPWAEPWLVRPLPGRVSGSRAAR